MRGKEEKSGCLRLRVPPSGQGTHILGNGGRILGVRWERVALFQGLRASYIRPEDLLSLPV